MIKHLQRLLELSGPIDQYRFMLTGCSPSPQPLTYIYVQKVIDECNHVGQHIEKGSQISPDEQYYSHTSSFYCSVDEADVTKPKYMQCAPAHQPTCIFLS